MAVVINMDMPQSCDHCRLVDYPWCYVMNSDDIECTCGMRPVNCPLIELTDGLWQVQDGEIWKYQGKGKIMNERLDKAIADVAYILDTLVAYRNIVRTGDCNNCERKGHCDYEPMVGQLVRYNCPHYRKG